MVNHIRRVVTTHNRAGSSTVLSDDEVTITEFPGGGAGALVWTTGTVPADNVGDLEGGARDEGMSLKGGSVLRVTEMGPGLASPMHRTLSVDYVYVLAGELEMELDDGTVVQLKPSDVVIQRGANHIWRNPSPDTPCRFLVSMIEAKPVSIGGTTFDPTL